MLLIIPAVLIIIAATQGVPLTIRSVGGLTLFTLPFSVPAVVISLIKCRRIIRFAVHERGIRFHSAAIPFTEIAKIEYAHPSLNTKMKGNMTAKGRMKLQYEYEKAFDIVLKGGKRIELRYMAYEFDSQDLDQAIDVVRAIHPEFFVSRDLKNLFSFLADQ